MRHSFSISLRLTLESYLSVADVSDGWEGGFCVVGFLARGLEGGFGASGALFARSLALFRISRDFSLRFYMAIGV